jgi:hypothetical protein
VERFSSALIGQLCLHVATETFENGVHLLNGATQYQLVRLAYQPPASSTFLSQQTIHQQPASSTFLSEQTSTH